MADNQSTIRFDNLAKAVGIIGALISAVVLIVSLRQNTNQRASELRWNQAKLAVELQDDMLINDPQSFDALRMTDWSAFNFIIDGKTVTVTRQEAKQALDPANNSSLPPNGVFVRERFDRLFYRMGRIERALESDLIKFDDVCSPMDYYVPFLRSTFGGALDDYMRQLHDEDARRFMNRFNDKRNCFRQPS